MTDSIDLDYNRPVKEKMKEKNERENKNMKEKIRT